MTTEHKPHKLRSGPSEEMEQLLRGEITSEEYVESVKQRSRALIAEIKARRPEQDRRAFEARSALARARHILRKYL